MKAADLIHLEPFGEAIQVTLQRFLGIRFGGHWSVRWISRRSIPAQNERDWLCNLHLNAIFRPGTPVASFEVLRREFARSVVAWRRPLQRAYFEFATGRFARTVAHAVIEIVPEIPRSEDWVVIPGTHKVRILDLNRNAVYCCRKANDAADHFGAELFARQRAADLGVRVPNILKVINDDCFLEELIVGTPLNRLGAGTDRSGIEREAIKSLAPLQDATSEVTDTITYANEISDRIREAAEEQEKCSNCRTTIEDWLGKILRTIERSHVRNIDTSIAHGDFQPGNLLWDGKALWLIDWEHSERRQRNYDRYVYFLNSRFPAGLASRINRFVQKLPHPFFKFSSAHRGNDVRAGILVFLLEELALHIRENANPAWPVFTPAWLQLSAEIPKVIAALC